MPLNGFVLFPILSCPPEYKKIEYELKVRFIGVVSFYRNVRAPFMTKDFSIGVSISNIMFTPALTTVSSPSTGIFPESHDVGSLHKT